MNWLIAATLGATLIVVFSCTPDQDRQIPLPPANPILVQKEKEKPEIQLSDTIDDRLARLQGQLDWVQHRIPKGHSK